MEKQWQELRAVSNVDDWDREYTAKAAMIVKQEKKRDDYVAVTRNAHG